MKKTKIIATVSPKNYSKEKILKLYKAGVNIIRFNFSHAKHDEVLEIVNLIKDFNKSGETNLSLLLDTKGPEIRTGVVENPIKIEKGEKFKIFVNETKKVGDNSIFCDYPYLIEDVEIGQIIKINSGLLEVEVVSKNSDNLEVKALNSAEIRSRRHINIPGFKLKFPPLTQKDIDDINFAIDNDFDFIAASFVRNSDCVKAILDIFKSRNNDHIKVISKIESQEGIDNLEEIVQISHGVMVARGDLGIEVPVEKLSLYQKQIVDLCNKYGKFVIIATHLLESMIENPFPTRAETSDIFNSVLSKPDCLMLSGETAIGKYPIQSVEIMSKIIIEAENYIDYKHEDYSNFGLRDTDIEKKLLIRSGIFIGEELEADALVIITKTGILARLASFFRPKIKVFAFTKFENTTRFINSLFGIEPIYHKKRNSDDYIETMDWAVNYLLENNLIKKGSKVIAVNDLQRGDEDISMMEILNV